MALKYKISQGEISGFWTALENDDGYGCLSICICKQQMYTTGRQFHKGAGCGCEYTYGKIQGIPKAKYSLYGKRISTIQISLKADLSKSRTAELLSRGNTPEEIVEGRYKKDRRKLELNGEKVSVYDLAALAGISATRVSQLLKRGNTPEEIATKTYKKIRKYKRNKK